MKQRTMGSEQLGNEQLNNEQRAIKQWTSVTKCGDRNILLQFW